MGTLEGPDVEALRERVKRAYLKRAEQILPEQQKCTHPVEKLTLQGKNRYICECGTGVRRVRANVLKRHKLIP